MANMSQRPPSNPSSPSHALKALTRTSLVVGLLAVALFMACSGGSGDGGHYASSSGNGYSSSSTGASTGASTGSGGGGVGGSAPSACTDYRMSLRGGETIDPAVVRVLFELTDCDGNAVSLTEDDFTIREDGDVVSEFESQQRIVPKEQAFELTTVLLLDMSGSIIGSGNLPGLQAAAKQLVTAITSGQDEHQVAIHAFEGGQSLVQVQAFTSVTDDLLLAIDGLSTYVPQDTSTNLNGAVLSGLDLLDAREQQNPDRIVSGTLAVFTDGNDQSGFVTDSEAEQAAALSRFSVFTIGLGGAVDQTHLTAIGKDGAFFAGDVAALEAAFQEVASAIDNLVNSLFVLAYCSPSRTNTHSLALELGAASIDFCFDAAGFGGGCEPANFLDPGQGSANDCPLNSGWPCTCTQPCQDGSTCILVDAPGFSVSQGICSPTCTGSCPCSNFGAGGECISFTGGEKSCMLTSCSTSADCPNGQQCGSLSNGKRVCYPLDT